VRAAAEGSRGGFSLLEIVVALVVIEIMLTGAVVTLQMGLRQARKAEVMERVIWEVMTLADSLSGGEWVAGRRARPWGELTWASEAVQAVDSAGVGLFRVEVLPLP